MPFTNSLLKYLKLNFVETGTYQGETIDIVNNYNKDIKIRSLELSKVFYERCVEKYKNNFNIKILNLNSKYNLYDSIQDINEEITFWLDGHWSGVPDVGCDIDTICPILFELEQIKQHNIKNHTIIIDDMRLKDNNHFPINKHDILKKIYEINSNYKIKYYNGCTEDDVLVAFLEENSSKKVCIHKYLRICNDSNIGNLPPGLGDFLRGTVALYKYSEIYNYDVFIDKKIHPIFLFFEENENYINDGITDNVIEIFNKNPIELENIFKKNENFSVITNCFYTKNENNNLENFGKISENIQQKLKSILIPNEILKNNIRNVFDKVYNLQENDKYKIIHLRFGDNFLINNIFDENIFYMYNNLIKKYVNSNKNIKIVLISDSKVALNIKHSIPEILYWDNNKTHLGGLNNNNENSILDTLTDFITLSKSEEIISNGSGFSKIISEIYNIKYTLLDDLP